MAKIRQFNILHFKKVKKMISDISPDDNLYLNNAILGSVTDLVQDILPLCFRKSPESYLAINDNDEVKAFITLEATKGNKHKWFIKRLFLDKNSFTEGKQLIDYVVAKYGALGADTFCVLIDENDDTSAELFSKMCGFRLCSREVLWHADEIGAVKSSYSRENFLTFSNRDRLKVANFFNEAIAPHFRFSLEKDDTEFYESFNCGFSKKSHYKMYIPDKKDNIIAYCELMSQNDADWIVDLVVNKPYENEYFPILTAFFGILKKRSKNPNIFVLTRNYLLCAKDFETALLENGFKRAQIKMLLVKDFYKPLKDEVSAVNPALIFQEISGKPAFILSDRLQKTD